MRAPGAARVAHFQPQEAGAYCSDGGPALSHNLHCTQVLCYGSKWLERLHKKECHQKQPTHTIACVPQTSVNTVGRAGRSNNSVARVIFALLYSEQVFRLRPNICKSTVSCQTHFLLKCTSQGRRNCGGALRNVGICQ